MKGTFYLNAGVLYGVAMTAYERTKSAPSDLEGGQNDALVAILFSAATLEALIMELAVLAESHGSEPLRTAAATIRDVEDSRGSVRQKYRLASFVLSSASYDEGAQPFQDFRTLFALRDAIIHMKPESVSGGKPQDLLNQLRGLGLCESTPSAGYRSWVTWITTRAVARWSCNVVPRMAESIRTCLPSNVSELFGDGWLSFMFPPVE